MRIASIAVIVAVCALAVSALLVQQRVASADGHGCPSSLPSQSAEGLHTDDRGKGWFLIRSSDSNGYTHVRAYAADDSYGPGYVPASPDETCYLIVRRPGDTADAAVPTQVTFRKDREVARTDDDITRAYVMNAIAYYDANGRDTTVDRYRSAASVTGGRSLTLLDANTSILLVYRTIPALQGQYVGPGSTFPGFQAFLANATAEGQWITTRAVNPDTKREEPRRIFFILHGGLVFMSSHSVLVEDVEQSTKEYVKRAIKYYDANGLDATVARYNSPDSLDGQFYLFLIGADDNYLAHPIFPHLIGTDIKDVKDSDGYELGKEIAKATQAGHRVEYLWPHPVTRQELPKVAWVVRHGGLIFASGYYTGGSEDKEPPWQNADPREYTVQYVNRAIERYERDGLESMLNYYNSVASFEGQWYLFATDANDIYHVHPLIPDLIGKDIKTVSSSDKPNLGKEIAAATEAGVWVEYLWPHPVTLREVPKVGYAVRKDGMIFASGYYPQVDDPAGHTKDYVQKAINYYKANGQDATVAHYSSQASADGQWNLTLADANDNDKVLVALLSPGLVGTDLKDLGKGQRRQVGKEMAAATTDGLWVSHVWPNIRSSETLYAHNWAKRYAGLLFISRYYDDKPDVPDAAKTDDQLTREYVEQAIDYYDDEGREATIAYYSTQASVSDAGRRLRITTVGDQTVLASPFAFVIGSNAFTAPGTPIGNRIGLLTAAGNWYESVSVNPQTGEEESRRTYGKVHDELIFESSHAIVRDDLGFTKTYVQEAIDYYDANGLDATVAYYDNKDNVEGQFYLFLIGTDDIYLAHPIFPRLKGTDIKDVKDTTGYELGKEIAKATTAGHWVDYLWPHPVTLIEEPKSAWVVRHDGLIFASGYYTPDPNQEPPAWQDANPREYTVTYVNNAIERYQTYGEQGLKDFYNSVGSFEGQWYLFVTDSNANDTYIVHGLLKNLIGTDIKEVMSSDKPDLGQQIAAATEEGVWVEYLWPHPFTLRDAPKVAYAKRYDGLVFASGYYPQVEDPAAQTKAYVAKAIAYYEANGRDVTVEYYNTLESVDREWPLLLLDENLVILAQPFFQHLIGMNASIFAAQILDFPSNDELAKVTQEGEWFQYEVPNPLTAEQERVNLWAVRHDGLLFTSAYTTSK